MSVVDGLASANFTDPHNQRIIYLAVGGLLLLALIVTIGTIVWWRSTKAEHPALAPLEVMGTRTFEKGDYTVRKRVLDEARMPGHPLAPDGESEVEMVDLQAAAEAPLPDPIELADPDHPIPSEGPESVVAPDDATVATDAPSAAEVESAGAVDDVAASDDDEPAPAVPTE